MPYIKYFGLIVNIYRGAHTFSKESRTDESGGSRPVAPAAPAAPARNIQESIRLHAGYKWWCVSLLPCQRMKTGQVSAAVPASSRMGLCSRHCFQLIIQIDASRRNDCIFSRWLAERNRRFTIFFTFVQEKVGVLIFCRIVTGHQMTAFDLYQTQSSHE